MMIANSLRLFNRLPRTEPAKMSRLTLYAGEIHRLDRACHIQVLSGQAWITVDDRDIILPAQESAQISLNRAVGLIAGVNGEAVTFEVCES